CYRAGPYYDARRPCYGAHDPCSSALPATITRSVARGRAMTEAEGLACTHPTPMLEYLRGPRTRAGGGPFCRPSLFGGYSDRRITDRKLRLFACACCRRIALVFTPERLARSLEFMAPMREYTRFGQFEPDCCVRAVELAERVAEGDGDLKQLASLR